MVVEKEIVIKDTHRGLLYRDGVLKEVLGAGKYKINRLGWFEVASTKPKEEIVLVDMRYRELTLKNQEILTSDKVAIRVSVLVQFRVVDAKAAVHEVESYTDRVYSDVQLAARRSLASMKLDEILTNRNRLSEDILTDVKEIAQRYGVSIERADVKDLAFPGNLQEVMNRVLAAQRVAEAQMIEAQTKADVSRIEAQSKAQAQELTSRVEADTKRRLAEATAEAVAISTAAELKALEDRRKVAAAYREHPALVRLEELATFRELGRNAQARLYVDFREGQGERLKPDEVQS